MPITVDDVYKQARQLSLPERQQLFERLLHDIAPEPPNTFHNDQELEAMLMEGIHSGQALTITPEYWRQKREQLIQRFGEPSDRHE